MKKFFIALIGGTALLLVLQLGGAFHNALFQFLREALGLGKQASVLDGDDGLVAQRAQDLQIIFCIDIRLITLGRKHTNGSAADGHGHSQN